MIAEETYALVRAEWKRRQAIEVPQGTLLVPTINDRINRLNPQERAELGRIVRSLKLRKIIRHTLAEAYWAGEALKARYAFNQSNSMEKLRTLVKRQDLMSEYERVLEPTENVTSIALLIARSNESTIIEAPQ